MTQSIFSNTTNVIFGLGLFSQMMFFATILLIGLWILNCLCDIWNYIIKRLHQIEQDNEDRHEQSQRNDSKNLAMGMNLNDKVDGLSEQLEALISQVGIIYKHVSANSSLSKVDNDKKQQDGKQDNS